MNVLTFFSFEKGLVKNNYKGMKIKRLYIMDGNCILVFEPVFFEIRDLHGIQFLLRFFSINIYSLFFDIRIYINTNNRKRSIIERKQLVLHFK